MKDRIGKIVEIIPVCDTLTDVGCDHGFISKGVLDEKKAKRVIFSDISEKCLKKAQLNLSGYVEKGLAKGVVCNGLEKIEKCDVVVIAGMGGEETVSILKTAPFLPETLVLQPMRNLVEVRSELISLGYKIEKDYVFKSSSKFYDLILARLGEDSLSSDELSFGRTNIRLKPKEFTERLQAEKCKLEKVLAYNNLSEEIRKEIENKLNGIRKYV